MAKSNVFFKKITAVTSFVNLNGTFYVTRSEFRPVLPDLLKFVYVLDMVQLNYCPLLIIYYAMLFIKKKKERAKIITLYLYPLQYRAAIFH